MSKKPAQCRAMTQKGTTCQHRAQKGALYCGQHRRINERKGKGKRKSPAEIAWRQNRALVLRIEQQLSYAEIAEQLDYESVSGAFKAVGAALDEMVPIDDVNHYRAVEGQRLELIMQAWWPHAVGQDAEGNPVKLSLSAAELVLRVMTRNARMMGLDNPIRTAAPDEDEHDPILDAERVEDRTRVIEQMEELRERIAPVIASGQ